MKKITLLFTLLLSISAFSQGTIEVLSFPNTFAPGAAIFGPAVGEDPIVIRFTNIALSTVNAPAPFRDTSAMISALSGITIPASGNLTDIDATNSKHNIGGTNRGFSTIHQKAPQDTTLPDNIRDYVDNGDGTMSFVFVHSRWSEGGGQTFVNGNEYTIIQRIFNRTDGKSSSAISVKDNGGTTVVAGMAFDSAATIETEANLFAKVNGILAGTLASKSYSVEKTISLYPNPSKGRVSFSKDLKTKTYKIFSITGSLIKEEKALSNSIDISFLKPGIYILSTDAGSSKLIKE